MRSGSPAQSCGHGGRRSTAAAVVADGAARQLKALHEKTPGVRNPCSFRTAYTDGGGFAFEVNGEHGSVQGWEDYSTHAGDAGVVTNTLGCRQLAQQSGGAQLLSIIDHYFGLYRTRSAHSCTIGFAVLLVLRPFYCFINNISATPQF